jgi:hypothetical protein
MGDAGMRIAVLVDVGFGAGPDPSHGLNRDGTKFGRSMLASHATYEGIKGCATARIETLKSRACKKLKKKKLKMVEDKVTIGAFTARL